MNLNTLGGRRFLLTLLTQCVSSYLLWYGKISSDAYSVVILGSVGAYIAGNTVQKIKGGVE
jgi:predicted small integral membrane protein